MLVLLKVHWYSCLSLVKSLTIWFQTSYYYANLVTVITRFSYVCFLLQKVELAMRISRVRKFYQNVTKPPSLKKFTSRVQFKPVENLWYCILRAHLVNSKNLVKALFFPLQIFPSLPSVVYFLFTGEFYFNFLFSLCKFFKCALSQVVLFICSPFFTTLNIISLSVFRSFEVIHATFSSMINVPISDTRIKQHIIWDIFVVDHKR